MKEVDLSRRDKRLKRTHKTAVPDPSQNDGSLVTSSETYRRKLCKMSFGRIKRAIEQNKHARDQFIEEIHSISARIDDLLDSHKSNSAKDPTIYGKDNYQNLNRDQYDDNQSFIRLGGNDEPKECNNSLRLSKVQLAGPKPTINGKVANSSFTTQVDKNDAIKNRRLGAFLIKGMAQF